MATQSAFRRLASLLVAVAGSLWIGSLSSAQDKGTAPSDDRAPRAEPPKDGQSASDPAEKGDDAAGEARKKPEGRVYGPPLMGREVSQLKKLHRTINEALNPTPEQKQRWDMLFDNYIKQMKAGMNTAGSFEGTAQDVPGMSERNPQSHRPGSGSEKAQRVLNAVTRPKYGSLAHPLSTHHVLASDVMDSMTPEQLLEFESLYQRWNTLRPKGIDEGPLARFSRALRDPKLKLDAEQRPKMRAIVKKYMDEVRESRRDKDKVNQAYEGAKAEVFEQLDETNLAQLKATLHEMDNDVEEWKRESEEYRRELAGRAGS